MSAINALLSGAVGMAALVIAMFFLRFWRHTRDRFFLFFAIAFALEAAGRVMLGLASSPNEDMPVFYLPRLVAYGLILVAVIDKNRK